MSNNEPQETETETETQIDSGAEEITLGMRISTAALRNYFESLNGEYRRSDEEIRQLVADEVERSMPDPGVSEDRVRELIDERAGGGGTLNEAQLRALLSEILDELGIKYHAEALDFPARRVGPSEPIGDYHSVSMWGVGFRTGRGCYIRSAKIDANESGEINVKLGEFDGHDAFDLVDETDIRVSGGVERVDLGLSVPEAGRYLLVVDSELPLRRGEWNGWDDHMVDNLRLVGGDKPGFSQNNYWYKLFDLEMTANENHEFPG